MKKLSTNSLYEENCGRSSVVEFQPSKLAVVGSNPIARSMFALRPISECLLAKGLVSESEIVVRAHVAQLVEHVLGKDEVTRSIRVVGSIYIEY